MTARMLTAASGFLERRSRGQILSFSLLLVALLGVIDYQTGEFALTSFYLVPVFVAGWFVGRRAGIAVCVAAGVAITIAHLLPPVASNHPTAMQLWNSAVE